MGSIHLSFMNYVIGSQISLLEMSVPKGYISRIRRTKPMSIPSSNDDYVIRMIPLIKLAVAGKQKMERTLNLYSSTETPLEPAMQANPILPPCPFSSPSPTQESSVSSSTTTSSSKT